MKPESQAVDATVVLRQAIELLRSDELEQAERALAQVLRQQPQQADALHFMGVLRHNQGRSQDGIALIQQSLTQLPDNAGAWNNLGNILLTTGAVDEAVKAYERGVGLADGGAQAAASLSNLSAIHLRQDRPDDAEAACRKALEILPDSAEAWYNLSLALMRRGDVHEGLLANSRAVALWPEHLQARDHVLRALLMLGEKERAANLYREWLVEDPDNAVVQHQLTACLGETAPARASDAYVQQVFDSFAASFDSKLEALGYSAPRLVTQALQDAAGPPRARLDIVDAGCGTGLCGPLLRPWARKLAGCDLSAGMLRRAKPRQMYDVLHQAELVYYLDTQPSRFDAVVSADTLCYFGELQQAFAAAYKCLRPGGWLIFTVEALPDDAEQAHLLQANGRYAHRRSYVEAMLIESGLQMRALAAHKLRSEGGKPVPGWLVTAARP